MISGIESCKTVKKGQEDKDMIIVVNRVVIERLLQGMFTVC